MKSVIDQLKRNEQLDKGLNDCRIKCATARAECIWSQREIEKHIFWLSFSRVRLVTAGQLPDFERLAMSLLRLGIFSTFFLAQLQLLQVLMCSCGWTFSESLVEVAFQGK